MHATLGLSSEQSKLVTVHAAGIQRGQHRIPFYNIQVHINFLKIKIQNPFDLLLIPIQLQVSQAFRA